ncbi:uncharacterized protein LOC130675743 [Microplitis mediator]|uniref:uncharacterized protein LOC130675743 n=1 Tax=Microplitis mediator TaxID=375433 RepID=UPI0025521DDF|nr:uncharacterized protein LOC130675743 [Microplitis mediator]
MGEQVPANYGNLDQEVYLTRSFLHLCGLWPGTTYLRYFSVIIFIFIVLWMPFAAYLYFFFSDTIENVVETTGYLMSVSYTILEIFIFRSNKTKITSIVEHMSDNWLGMTFIPEKEKKMINKNLSKSRFAVRMAFSFVTFCLVFYSIMPYVIALILGKKFPRQAARVAWYPFPLENSFVIFLTSSVTLAAIFLIMLIEVAIDGFLILLVYHSVGQLRLLRNTIDKYRGLIRHPDSSPKSWSSSRDFKKSCPCLKCIVDHHVDIEMFVEEINNSFSKIIFIKTSVTIIKFCAMGFFVVQSAHAKNISGIIENALYVFWSGFSLIIYCWLGEILGKKSDDIARAVCEIDWSIKKRKKSLSLMLIIIRCRKPFAITAGKIFTMNLIFYKETIKNRLIKIVGSERVILV